MVEHEATRTRKIQRVRPRPVTETQVVASDPPIDPMWRDIFDEFKLDNIDDITGIVRGTDQDKKDKIIRFLIDTTPPRIREDIKVLTANILQVTNLMDNQGIFVNTPANRYIDRELFRDILLGRPDAPFGRGQYLDLAQREGILLPDIMPFYHTSINGLLRLSFPDEEVLGKFLGEVIIRPTLPFIELVCSRNGVHSPREYPPSNELLVAHKELPVSMRDYKGGELIKIADTPEQLRLIRHVAGEWYSYGEGIMI